MSITVLGLQLPTDPRWVDLANISLEAILTDHAYCEQKAASSCISLIQVYSSKEYLIERLAPVVSEEWGHFRMVLSELKKRGLKLGNQRKDEYVRKLATNIRRGVSDDERLMDKLLMSALIEARSCERFRLLSEGISEESLREFYYNLMVAEAAHYRMFLDIAKYYCDEVAVMKRWKEWLKFEVSVMKDLEIKGDRIH